MADFRRWIIALAVLALFAGLASAQTGGTGGSTISCSANTSNTPTLRQEGITEQVGDIVITCTGGNSPDGVAVPQVNITVALGSQVTTRLVSATTGVSHALLFIDEPTTGGGPVAGYGSNAVFTPCPNPGPTISANGIVGCNAYPYHVAGSDTLIYTKSVNGTTTGVTVGPPPPLPTAVNAANIYQGVVLGNQVTFFGVPIVAPGTNGARVYRITNVRINATPLSAGSAVQAFIQTSNPAALPISNAQPVVGFVTHSLKATASSAAGFPQCVGQTLAQANLLTYSEDNNFASAFKTRVDPTVAGQAAPTGGGTAGQGSNLVQSTPGKIYNSETGFTVPATLDGSTGNTGALLQGTQIGLTDFGTRLKAVFTNIPPSTKLYVSVFGVTTDTTTGLANGDVSTGATWAQLVTSETAAEPSFVAAGSTTKNGVHLAEIDVAGSTSATAVWEIVATQPTAIDTLKFAVYVTYTPAGTTSPAIGTTSVNLSYAPTSTVTTASTTAPIPRFLDTSSALNAYLINPCQTVLLFPFLTNTNGFDTGIAISNTSTDPFGTTPQAGTCKLYYYGNASTTVSVPTIASATTYVTTLSAAPATSGFQGYMIALCGFQYAHGFAFVSDLGARNLAMGYLALVIPDPSQTAGARGPNPFPNAGNNSGEQLGY